MAARRMVPSEQGGIAAALAAAFEDDPVFRWITPDDELRAEGNRIFFDALLDAIATHDDVWTVDGLLGAAAWAPYRQALMTPEDEETFVARLASMPGANRARMKALDASLNEAHPKEPHEYLWYLGVKPSAQGRGLGRTLLAPVLRRADVAGVPAYLEATGPRNRALYERHGFRAGAPVSVDDSPLLWPMWREPISAA